MGIWSLAYKAGKKIGQMSAKQYKKSKYKEQMKRDAPVRRRRR